jgi:two-component system cell cycle sensor histidine kinase/response regulator CckA
MIASKNGFCAETEQVRPMGLPEHHGANGRQYGVLVVDDEASIRRLLSVGMQQRGFAVWLAASGQEALDLYRRHHQAIDLVLIDVCMQGMDGPQTLAALQELNPQIRCCFMSGHAAWYTEESLHKWSGVAVLRKPFRLAEVAQVLREMTSGDNLSLSSSGKDQCYAE